VYQNCKYRTTDQIGSNAHVDTVEIHNLEITTQCAESGLLWNLVSIPYDTHRRSVVPAPGEKSAAAALKCQLVSKINTAKKETDEIRRVFSFKLLNGEYCNTQRDCPGSDPGEDR
jgi:hypothetical protein